MNTPEFNYELFHDLKEHMNGSIISFLRADTPNEFLRAQMGMRICEDLLEKLRYRWNFAVKAEFEKCLKPQLAQFPERDDQADFHHRRNEQLWENARLKFDYKDTEDSIKQKIKDCIFEANEILALPIEE